MPTGVGKNRSPSASCRGARSWRGSRIVQHLADRAKVLNPDSAPWTIDGQPGSLDGGDMTGSVPIVFHAATTSDACFYSALLANN